MLVLLVHIADLITEWGFIRWAIHRFGVLLGLSILAPDTSFQSRRCVVVDPVTPSYYGIVSTGVGWSRLVLILAVLRRFVLQYGLWIAVGSLVLIKVGFLHFFLI